MNQSAIIYSKLEFFIKKFYTNELIKGLIFFFGLGLMFLYVVIFVEYTFWLSSFLRTVLFLIFVCVEIFLFCRFIIFPALKLTKLKKGLDYVQASQIIGMHFPEVSDKLLNFLQLTVSDNNSELMVASIEQKADNLKIVPFQAAINFKANRRFLPVVLAPIIIYGLVKVFGFAPEFGRSFDRVLSFQKQFNPPAPFRFQLLNKSLIVEQGQDITIVAKTIGTVVPEEVTIVIGNESYVMPKRDDGTVEFIIKKPMVDASFYFAANAVNSPEYTIDVAEVPAITNFEMVVNYPSYLGRKSEVIKGSGNAIVPEGAILSWKVQTLATDRISFKTDNNIDDFVKSQNKFQISKKVNQNIDYQIVTSNRNISNYEVLNYKIAVQKDMLPVIEANLVSDSIKRQEKYIVGRCSDDHGLSKLQIVYYPSGKVLAAQRANIALKSSVSDQFLFVFPSNLPVQAGVSYDFYFEVFDNDIINGFKSAKSTVFSDVILTASEKEDLNLKQENENIDGMSRSIKQSATQLSEIDKLQKLSKEKETFDFNEQKKVEDFLKKQSKQDQSVKELTQKLKENLQKSKDDKNPELKNELEKRLDNQLKQLEKNEKLLEQLKDLNDKLKKDELSEQLDKFKQNAKNQAKNLEQLVELTKRYYVEKKLEQVMDKLDKLADKQDKIADTDQENNKDKQAEINKEFDKIQEDLKDLKKDNNELKAPMDVPNDVEKEKSIDEDLKKAVDELSKDAKDGKQKAKPKQKSAAKKMKEMSSKMKESMDGAEMDQLEEDVAMLRQILDNLLSFSFSEEATMSQFKNIKRNSPSYNKSLKQQQDLRLQFQHVDDSLFALGLRNPKISELINTEVGSVHYNINKAVEVLVESNVSKGVFHQQYAVSSANKLADMLSETLNNMQMDMQGMGKGKPKKGKGKGSGMQLPDIIKKQDGISKKLEKGNKPGSKPGDKPGDGKDGKPSDSGKGGKDGEGKEDGEGNAGEIMKIYQEQKQLREALQNELNSKGLGGAGQNALDQMKQLEKQLLNKGFKNEVLQKSLNIKQELLKLDKAIQEQGQEQRRQADGAKEQFQNKATQIPAAVRDYLNSIEILNKLPLPLNPNHEQRTKLYFNNK